MKFNIVYIAIMGIIVAALAACDQQGKNQVGQQQSSQDNYVANVANVAMGERLFNTNCARCHGMQGRGTDQGPPLMHQIYRPAHHSDMSFQMAVAKGSQQHHWNFGNMPPVAGVTAQNTADIIAYVRQEQRKVGIQ